ncbi:hypothetical protein AHiyo4_19250 [Arthrobacter sp. Hiyo4]|nr:hypothetical protein AHiyo4_19250 [Arthrobacter sp. Hiyo4]
MIRPTSWASISAAPEARICSSTSWARSARSSSLTGRPWHALRTPLMTLLRLKGSPTPERLITERLVVSTVVNLRPHSGHCRRRRMAEPSSAMRLSTTRESGLRQNGQYMVSPPSMSSGADVSGPGVSGAGGPLRLSVYDYM